MESNGTEPCGWVLVSMEKKSKASDLAKEIKKKYTDRKTAQKEKHGWYAIRADTVDGAYHIVVAAVLISKSLPQVVEAISGIQGHGKVVNAVPLKVVEHNPVNGIIYEAPPDDGTPGEPHNAWG